jgi:hypothetical protein
MSILSARPARRALVALASLAAPAALLAIVAAPVAATTAGHIQAEPIRDEDDCTFGLGSAMAAPEPLLDGWANRDLDQYRCPRGGDNRLP